MSDYVSPKLYGIIGAPLAHSLSPMLHSAAFSLLGLPGILLPWPMESEKLPAFVEAIRILDIQGCCVTIPHKERIIPLLDKVTDRVKGVGAVNLVYREGNLLCGENTDVLGFMSPLEKTKPRTDAAVLLLGAGGGARAAVVGLKALGYARIFVSGATLAKAERLAAEFGLVAVPWEKRTDVEAEFVVNTTPLGMRGNYENDTPYPADGFAKRAGVAYDIVYTPFTTRFLGEAEAAGWRTIGGLDMFLSQADHQFRIWTGRNLPKEACQLAIDALKG